MSAAACEDFDLHRLAPEQPLQAASPLLFGLVIERFGSVSALVSSASLSLSAFVALLALRDGDDLPTSAQPDANRQ